ncbi:SDR family NAD(P)-dependent oxidoreductase [Streptomyces albireticuli]|uniref:Short-chain dehydrogenase n=1 Tax=Streptomyces albireticuli TaxID=1940 RepID=A0A2A2DGQ0_9ACTN|nr:glucose 1-dehydrogenase [Streptomyces albireticuli]MCD9143882.1 glucose 1-dehydrogenase [Streptomyces albireticuli]MCD9161687.1 glucose 1-dehydrogenase [Streptomyces albireticuli]MCD9191999.1 glucose 1-dehydrogenase [Streptomyces albireticuli]PAU50656.1 short-chain dehydrogenase [Streptomyces albireticuli]
MTARFTGKVALVTGGGSNIGRQTALTFARGGATVVVAGPVLEDLNGTVKLIEEEGGTASAVVTDVTRSADVARMVETTVERHGGLHIAFNNAGIVGRPGPSSELDDDVWAAVFAVNTTGVWLSMKHEVEYMRAHGGGVIVNSASNIGFHGRKPGMGAYAASKGAVSILTRTAAREYIAEGVRINAVSPGGTNTPMSFRPGETVEDRDARVRAAVPIGRVGETREIADAVCWLASDEASFVVGHDLVVDGGATA